jgi:tRNA pseudouridine32 synthase/23S rRNA pseudouridine746 synthase
MVVRHAPLPMVNGVMPSFVDLPQGKWPDLLTFLIERFPHIDEAEWRARLARGDLVNQDGLPFTVDNPYPARQMLWYYREVPDERMVPFREKILYRDERLVVADKPHFLASIPTGKHLRETLLARLRDELNLPELTPIHRLDRATAGVMLFCADAQYRHTYQTMFSRREVKKEYHAIAPHRPDLALPRTHRIRMEERPDIFTMHEVAGAPNSETFIELMEVRGEWARYRLWPHNGKKHQLRLHMATLQIPIRNDPWYPTFIRGCEDNFDLPLQLLAKSIAFTDPISGEARRFESERELEWP